MGMDDKGRLHGERDGRYQPQEYPKGDLVLTRQDDDEWRSVSRSPTEVEDVDQWQDDEVGGYLAKVALWAGTGEDEEPLDDKFDISNIDKDSLQAEVEKVQKFWSEATALHLTDWCDKDEFVYDFWLDRNGGGTGFWDRCPKEDLGRKLSKMAKQYGHCDLLEGDDGTLSFCPN
jgi:hypothetical protein